MQMKYGICSQCSKEGNNKEALIVNRRHMLCQAHNKIRLDLQSTKIPSAGKGERGAAYPKKKRYSETFQYDVQWGFTKEMEMFIYIWQNSPHVSEISGKPIQFHPGVFMHVLAKGLNQFPYYRLNPENIMLGTKQEHFLIDQGTKEGRKKYEINNPPADFSKFFDKVEKLKKEYQKAYLSP